MNDLRSPTACVAGSTTSRDPHPPRDMGEYPTWVVGCFVEHALGYSSASREEGIRSAVTAVDVRHLVSSAPLGVTVGFGAQRLVQDLFSGFFLLAEHQLAVGDVIRISAPGTTEGVGGTVEEITLRVTRLRTLKGEVVFIPNGEIRQVTNLSVEWARLVLDVPLRPDEDFNRAITVLRDVCKEMWADERWAVVLLENPEVLGLRRSTWAWFRSASSVGCKQPDNGTPPENCAAA